MKSILIKDTTREEREQIVNESLGIDDYSNCGAGEGFEIDYQLYIDGVKELRELNDEFRGNTVVASRPEDERGSSCATF